MRILVVSLLISLSLFGDYIWVDVAKSTPIYEEYYREYPKHHGSNYQDRNSFGIDSAIGAIAGVALGNQIGRGSGKDVARVAGGVAGAVVANSFRNSDRRYYRESREKRVLERRLVGYDNLVVVRANHRKHRLHFRTQNRVNRVKLQITDYR